MLSPERTSREDDDWISDETDGSQVESTKMQPTDNLEEKPHTTTFEDTGQLSHFLSTHKPHLKTVQSVKLYASTKCSEKYINVDVVNSTTIEDSRRQKDEKTQRKWTSDVIFEAEQQLIKSEIDKIQAKKSDLKTREPKHEGILRDPPWEQLKETKCGQRMSSSAPSSVTDYVEAVRVWSQNSDNSSIGSTTYLKDQVETNSRNSSIIRVAKKISRSKSRSLKSLNNPAIENEKYITISVVPKQQQKEEGAFALLRASKNDSIFQLQTLVSHGISTEIIDRRGWTPLTVALENGNIECAEVLVEMTANVNFVHTNGMTILHHVTSNGMYKAVKFLLRHGAHVNKEDSQGWPAVHHAIKKHHLKCTALLLAAGSDSQVYTRKRVKQYEDVVRLATVGKWNYHWQQILDIDMGNEVKL